MAESTFKFNVDEISDGRYRLGFPAVRAALNLARSLKDKGMIKVPVRLKVDAGESTLIDMEVNGTPLSLTLVFKVVLHMEGETFIEWWSRRRTDPDLLDLWTEVLDMFDNQEADSSDRLDVASECFDFFRRSCSERPHQALGLEEGASPAEVRVAYDALFKRGESLLSRCEDGGRIRLRMQQAMTAIRQANQSLTAA